MYKVRNFFRPVLWAWQRVVRGYDDRIFWEFDSYFAMFIPAIRRFCVETLEHVEDTDGTLTETLNLLAEWEMVKSELCVESGKYDSRNYDADLVYSLMEKESMYERRFWTYVGAHMQRYWL